MKKTTDLWFVSYLNFGGFPVSSFRIIRQGKVEFTFEMPDELWNRFKLEFNDSEIQRYKQRIEALKDLGY
jgi:hypothetical protein